MLHLRPRSALLGLAVFILTGQPAAAQTPDQLVELAESHYQRDRLLDAERVFREALPVSEGQARRRCYERLMRIYVRLGRQDQAIRQAGPFAGWLKENNDESRLSELSLEVAECYLVLGHFHEAPAHFDKALAATGEAALPPRQKLAALAGRARAFEFQRDQERAGRAWKDVADFALTVLDAPTADIPARLRAEAAWRIADSYRFHGEPAKAVARLTPLLPLLDDLKEPLGKRDTLKQLADHLVVLKDLAAAEQRLTEAIALHDKHDGGNRFTHGELCAALAAVIESRGRKGDTETWRTRAAADYDAVLRDPNAGQPGMGGPLAAFWKLQLLYQHQNQFQTALKLTVDQAEQWSGAFLLQPRLKAEQGGLQVLLGAYPQARTALRTAVAALGDQKPLNLVEYPRALNNLAIVELAADERDKAEEFAKRCLGLYQEFRLPDDLLLIETLNLLGTCAAQNGDYADAIRRFRDGIGRAERLGEPADSQRTNLLLNVALLLKAQGDIPEALRLCQEALAIFRRHAAPDDPGFMAFAAAEASMYAAQARVAEAADKATYVLELCRKHGIHRGPLIIAARHVLALRHLQKREYDEAEADWREVLKQQEEERLPLLVPRTLNYLGLTDECRRRPREAEAFYRRARELQHDNPRAFPLTHYMTLWRLADLADRGSQPAEARALLDEAVAVIEAARMRTYGDAQQRADFFAQVAPALEQMVDRAVRDGDVEAAFAAAARGRSRTLMDQLLLAGVDPRTSLTDAEGQKLAARERELARKVTALRARAQLLPPEAVGGGRAKDLLAELDRAQADYAVAWREVLNASPIYRGLSDQDLWKTALPTIRKNVLGPKTVMLTYFIGEEKSYVLLLGDRGVRSEAFALEAPKDLAARIGKPKKLTLAEGLSGRGVVLVDEDIAPNLPKESPAAGPMTPLTHDLAGTLVDHYLARVARPRFDPTCGLRLEAVDPDRPIPPQRPELIGDVFLPHAVRKRLAELRPECVVVVPDGALHKLPLEALLLKAGSEPRYAIDELPPLAYAPSIAALAYLSGRAGPTPHRLASLLTVGDPAYPDKAAGPAKGVLPAHALLLPGGLPRLEFSGEESKRLRRFFQPEQVTALVGADATKAKVVAAMKGRSVIHLAAHGFADERFGNLFGVIVLAPPSSTEVRPDDDGYLSLHEICQLPLKDCELAVLSACLTNVGPQRPLEASITLAGGFLTAGAHRVVGSQWGVSDRSTALLVETFFERIASAQQGDHFVYARALQDARKKVRAEPRWSSPFYWAPFVLIGPPD
jgi:CHAT domain-containing protein/tetratricopeptide (TPR) repeat protein